MRINLMIVPRPEDTTEYRFISQIEVEHVPRKGETVAVDGGFDRPLLLRVSNVVTLYKARDRRVTVNVHCHLAMWSDGLDTPDQFERLRERALDHGFTTMRTRPVSAHS